MNGTLNVLYKMLYYMSANYLFFKRFSRERGKRGERNIVVRAKH